MAQPPTDIPIPTLINEPEVQEVPSAVPTSVADRASEESASSNDDLSDPSLPPADLFDESSSGDVGSTTEFEPRLPPGPPSSTVTTPEAPSIDTVTPPAQPSRSTEEPVLADNEVVDNSRPSVLPPSVSSDERPDVAAPSEPSEPRQPNVPDFILE